MKNNSSRSNAFLGNLSLIVPMLGIAFLAITKIFGNIFTDCLFEMFQGANFFNTTFVSTLLEWSTVGGWISLILCITMVVLGVSFLLFSLPVSGLTFARSLICEREGIVRAVAGGIFTLISPLVILLVFKS